MRLGRERYDSAMYQLLHLPLAPHCRYVRLVLAEKGVEAELTPLPGWGGGGDQPRLLAFGELSPEGDFPALRVGARTLHGPIAIGEFVEEAAPGRRLLPTDPIARAETRRLVEWFSHRLYEDATRPLLEEKVVKRLRAGGAPDSMRVREATAAARRHLAVIDALADRRSWLAGEEMTLADFAAAAQISSLDYVDAISWEPFANAKAWYALMKCRPSFRGLLADRAPGMAPATHYADLDF